MALYLMAIRSHDDKRRTYPFLQASQVSISSSMRPPVDFPQTHINARFLSHIDRFGQNVAITGGDEAQRNSRPCAWHCSVFYLSLEALCSALLIGLQVHFVATA